MVDPQICAPANPRLAGVSMDGRGCYPTPPAFSSPARRSRLAAGYRIIACKQGERVTLWTRYGADFIDRLLTIAWRGSCRSAAAASI